MIDPAIIELEQACNDCSDENCSNCEILEEINEIRSSYVHGMIDEDLEFDCQDCSGRYCKGCIITKEIDWRRKIRTGRDVAHDGSIIEGGGVSQPEWMDEDQYAEYKMTAEYAHEVSYHGFDEPDEDDYY